MKIETRAATDQDMNYVISHLRPSDAKEVAISGVEPMWRAQPNCVVIDGVPCAIRGLQPDETHIWAFFVGTEVCNLYPVTLMKMAQTFVLEAIVKYPNLILAAQVWDEYAKSIEWLEHLGFVNTHKYITDHILTMEFNGSQIPT